MLCRHETNPFPAPAARGGHRTVCLGWWGGGIGGVSFWWDRPTVLSVRPMNERQSYMPYAICQAETDEEPRTSSARGSHVGGGPRRRLSEGRGDRGLRVVSHKRQKRQIRSSCCDRCYKLALPRHKTRQHRFFLTLELARISLFRAGSIVCFSRSGVCMITVDGQTELYLSVCRVWLACYPHGEMQTGGVRDLAISQPLRCGATDAVADCKPALWVPFFFFH